MKIKTINKTIILLFTALAVSVVPTIPLKAQVPANGANEHHASDTDKENPQQIIDIKAGVVRTPQEMKNDAATYRAQKSTEIIRRSTIPQETLNQLKTEAEVQAPNQSKPDPSTHPADPTSDVSITASCNANSQSEGYYPPDTHGAVGLTQFVEVTNSRISVFNKSDCTSLLSLPLSAFFGYIAVPGQMRYMHRGCKSCESKVLAYLTRIGTAIILRVCLIPE